MKNAAKGRSWKETLAVTALLVTGSYASSSHSLGRDSSPLPVPDRARYVFQRVAGSAELATITPVCLFQDRQGFIWIGSMNGLLRYDGAHVVKFGVAQGLPGTSIEQVAQTTDGRIWVATRHGLAVQSGDAFRSIALPQGVRLLSLYQVMAIAASGESTYVATDHGLWAVAVDDPNRWLAMQQHSFPSGEVEAVYAAPDGRVWFASDGRVGWFSETRQAHWLPGQSELPKEPIVALLEDAQRRLWLRTARHLLRLDFGASHFEFEAPGLPAANDIGMPSIDREGRLMVPTVAGLYLHRGDHWDVVDKTRGAASNAVFSAMEDREGTYWLGYGGHGMQRWQGERTWSGWTDVEGLPDNVVWSELRDTHQRLWIATNNGVAMWDGAQHRFRTWKERDGLNGLTARRLALARDGSIWVLCHPGGLTRFDPVSLRPEKVTVPGPDLTHVGLGPDGRIWVAAPHSLKALRTPVRPWIFEDVPAPQEIVDGITSFSTAPDGTLWTSGRQGLGRYDGHAWSQYSHRDGLLSDGIGQALAVDRNEVWVRYSDAPGITRLGLHNQVPEVAHFGSAQGLRSDEVFMLGRDLEGNVWAGGARGLARIAPDGQVRCYGHADGLLWDDQSEEGFFAEQDGTILFGTSGGLARFDPHVEATLRPVPPSVIFTSLQLGGHERLTEKLPHATHKENTLNAEFAVLSYKDPAALRCRYRLVGLDGEFTEAMGREIHYAALAPGDYALEVACQAGAGIKGTPAVFSFQVLPAWWQRWWIRDLGLAVLGMALYGVLRFRTYSLEKDRRRLELAVAERSQELERLNQELREASLTDPLTGTRNRRFFQVTIENDVRQAVRSYLRETDQVRNRDLIFYLIDADHFKEVNDLYGHAAGDELLAEMTRRIQSAIRMSDVLVRWGGEEFLVVSRYTERSQATTLASRILQAIGNEPFVLKNAPMPLRKTCSIGWAAFPWFCTAPDAVRYEIVVELADRALYVAKQKGRNHAVGMLPVQADLETPSLTPEQLRATQITTPGPEASRSAQSAG